MAVGKCTPEFDREKRVDLPRGQDRQVRKALRRIGQWHYDLFEGRRPALRVRIHPTEQKDVFVARAAISIIFRGERVPEVFNHVTVTRKDGRVKIRAPHPFVPYDD